jgi:cytochrome P450
MSTQQNALPSHVPPELAMEFPLTTRATGYVNPFKEIIPKIHEGPDIFWGTNIFPGPSGGWVVRKQADLIKIYENTTDFIKKGNSEFSSMIGETWDAIPTELDPPKHTAFRRALEPVFSPKKMAELEHKVANRADELIDKFKNKGKVEFIKEFATPFPCTIVLDLLGLDCARLDEFLGWEHNILHTNNMSDRRNAIRTLKAFLMQEIEARQKNPTDDLISNALTMEAEGRKWTTVEVFGHCFNLFIGGLDTVTANLGHQFYHLATHLDDQKLLRENPEKIGVAVLELMRAYSAVTTMRICARDTEINGLKIKVGDRVAMSTPLGSNDPEAYDNPTEVRLDRRPVHIGLGHGIHRCLGQHLARREINVAIKEMLAALPEFTLEPDFKVSYLMSNVMHVNELRLVW